MSTLSHTNSCNRLDSVASVKRGLVVDRDRTEFDRVILQRRASLDGAFAGFSHNSRRGQTLFVASCLDESGVEARHSLDENVPECGPQRKNSIVRDQMSAQPSVLAAVQSNMLNQKVTECAKRGFVPIRRCNH